MADKKSKILVVDDEQDITEFLSYNLEKEGYQVETASNGVEAVDKARQFLPDLILLDVMMPGMDGVETCERLRSKEETQHTLIAFLTARSEDYSQIAGFEAGGDDYITKPIKPKVLLSRIKALLKRQNVPLPVEEKGKGQLQLGDILIDMDRYTIYKGKEELIMPKKEFELLLLLCSKPGKVFTRDEIFRMVWDDNVIVGDRTIDVHIRKLREKIGDHYIKTIKGVGYKFAD